MMRRWIAAAVVAIWLQPLTAAQDQESRAEELRERLDAVVERLELTPEQLAEVGPIVLDGLRAIRDLLEGYGIQRGGGRPAGLGIRDLRNLQSRLDRERRETLVELAGVLTEEQLDTYRGIQEENRQELRARIRQRR